MCMCVEGGDFVTARASRVIIHMRQEENPVQRDLVSWCWFRLLRSNTRQFILDILKYSVTLDNSFRNSMCAMKLKAGLL